VQTGCPQAKSRHFSVETIAYINHHAHAAEVCDVRVDLRLYSRHFSQDY
jgi:hypothetical protein